MLMPEAVTQRRNGATSARTCRQCQFRATHTDSRDDKESKKEEEGRGEGGGVDRTAIEQDDGEWMRLGDWPSDLLHFKFGDIFCMSFIFIAYAKN